MSESKNQENEGFVDSLSDLVSEVARRIEAVLLPDEAAEETTPKNETVENEIKNQTAENETKIPADNKNLKETRVGYVSNLPQPSEEPETETIVEPDDTDEIEAAIARARETQKEPETEVFKDDLVVDALPALPRQNRARLDLQSPNRVYLYWSLAGNPFETLTKAFGSRANNYQLVTRLINLGTNAETFTPAEIQGNWWYNVRSNQTYRVDVGFFAQNRPFIRLFSSNTVKTPRAAPSPRVAQESDWIISTRQFVEVLTASGYSRDVFDVAFQLENAGTNAAEFAAPGEILSEDFSTLAVAKRFAPLGEDDLNLSELRWFFVSLAAGAEFVQIKNYLSDDLKNWLAEVLENDPRALTAENVRTVLESIFGSEFVQLFAEENIFGVQKFAPVAVGASAIHFPEVNFPRLRFPELRPVGAEPANPYAENYGEEEFNLHPSSDEFL